MQQPHIIPIAVNLSRSLPKHRKPGSASHYVQLEGNVISINNPPMGVSDIILEELRTIFRKYCHKNLHKLHLRFNSCNGLTRFTLKKLRLEIVASFRELRELTLEFYFCNIKNKSFMMFLTSIRNVTKRLKKFAISFIGCRKINGKGIECLRLSFIPNLKALQKLALNFSQEPTRSDDNNELLFGSNIEKRIIASRRRYERSRPVSLISNQSVLNLVNTCTKYLRSLRQFDFIPPYFNNPSISDYQTYKEMIISATKNFEKLKKLHIQLQSLTTEDIDEISFYIGKYPNSLQYLSVDIHLNSLFSDITNQDLTTLATNIVSQKPTLRGLALSFNDDTRVNEEGLWNFGVLLCQYAKNLEEFGFQIRPSFSANNKKFEDFVSVITNQLTCLKRCTLSILQAANHPRGENQTKKITQIQQAIPQSASQSLQEFSLYLSNFTLCSLHFFAKLRSLTLSFDDCGEMTNDDCVRLTRNLFQLPLQDLEQFALRCRNSRQISDKSIISFCSHDWSGLSRLSSLALEFSSSKFITDSAVEHIEILILKNLKNLQRFSLGFLCCDRITEGGIISLVNTITEKHSDIKELVLDFHHDWDKKIRFPDRTKMIKNEMNANLKSLEKLKLNF